MTKSDFERLLTVSGAAEFLQLSQILAEQSAHLRRWPAIYQNGSLRPLQPAGARRVQAGERAGLHVRV